jgi:transcriptional regulator with XRE-family HTH domain
MLTQNNRKDRILAARTMALAWVREQMQRKDVTVLDLVSMSGLSRKAIDGVVKGRTAFLPTLNRIANALGTELPPELADIATKQRNWGGFTKLNGKSRPEWVAFRDMHRRVSDPEHRQYHRYGGKGIRIHPDWSYTLEGLQNFFKDVGPRPSKHSLHRTPPTANYGPRTAKWADGRTQRLERRGTIVFEVNGTPLGRKEFQHVAKKDGFLCVIERDSDGSLKNIPKPKRKK